MCRCVDCLECALLCGVRFGLTGFLLLHSISKVEAAVDEEEEEEEEEEDGEE